MNVIKKKKQQKLLRKIQQTQGLLPKPHGSLPNATSAYDTVEEEKEGRTEAVTGQMRIIKAQLPRLLCHSRPDDRRDD